MPRTSLRLRRGVHYDPWEHADALGIQVLERPLRSANEIWLPEYDTIVVQSGLRQVHKRNALAHGIGHADLGHCDDRPKHEVQADRYAALYLIEPRELAAVVAWCDEPRVIAAELGITRRLLEAYLQRVA